jgi:hypothetical protein
MLVSEYASWFKTLQVDPGVIFWAARAETGIKLNITMMGRNESRFISFYIPLGRLALLQILF